jgi:hypothetical protein
VGPDGTIWFTEPGADRVGTVSPDGAFGDEYSLRSFLVGNTFIGWRPELTFDPEGNLWLVVEKGLLRLTPSGQQTLYPGEADGSSVMTGSEGDIWWLGYDRLRRIEPGAPGLDILETAVDRHSSTVSVRLACGGSTRGCEGKLRLALWFPKASISLPKGVEDLPPFRFVDTRYSVSAESVRTLVLKIPPKAFVLAKRYGPRKKSKRWGFGVNATATVIGGPPLERRIKVPAP